MKRNLTLNLLACALLAPALACAHPQSATSGFLDGLSHPFLGLDHLLAMLMVGVFAVQLGGRAIWIVPATFVAATFVGGMLGAAGIAIPLLEPLVAASVLLLGLMAMQPARLDAYWAAGLAAIFALFHGIAHTAEAGADANLISQFVGFMFATASLHLLGILAAWPLRHRLGMLRMVAAPIAIGGACLLIARLG